MAARGALSVPAKARPTYDRLHAAWRGEHIAGWWWMDDRFVVEHLSGVRTEHDIAGAARLCEQMGVRENPVLPPVAKLVRRTVSAPGKVAAPYDVAVADARRAGRPLPPVGAYVESGADRKRAAVAPRKRREVVEPVRTTTSSVVPVPAEPISGPVDLTRFRVKRPARVLAPVVELKPAAPVADVVVVASVPDLEGWERVGRGLFRFGAFQARRQGPKGSPWTLERDGVVVGDGYPHLRAACRDAMRRTEVVA
jgi:hypothetical protein